jgi:hypothetical protein
MRIDVFYMLLILLLPVIPAFLLFRFLPSSADVQGPFQGFTVKLGGAFAGYFVTVLLSWLVARSLLEPTWSDNWNVVAHIAFDGTPPNHPSPKSATVLVQPPSPDIKDSGELQMMVPIPRVHSEAIYIPTLVVAADGYETADVPLDPDNKHLGALNGQDYQVTFDEVHHLIRIGKPIVLTKAQ